MLEVAAEFAQGPTIFVSHSVSAMIGMLADLCSPGKFAAHIMVGPLPCYVNDGDYVGGFERADIVAARDVTEGTLPKDFLYEDQILVDRFESKLQAH